MGRLNHINMKTEHLSPQDQKALIIARFFASVVMIVCLVVLTFTALYLRELKEQDKRIEYINELHSELK